MPDRRSFLRALLAAPAAATVAVAAPAATPITGPIVVGLDLAGEATDRSAWAFVASGTVYPLPVMCPDFTRSEPWL